MNNIHNFMYLKSVTVSKRESKMSKLNLLVITTILAMLVSSLVWVRASGSTFTPTAPLTIKIMSYNVLFGAGVDRRYDNLLLPELRNKNRLPELVSFIKGAQLDILGIEEANGWNRGDPAVVEQVAEQLGMNYYLAEAPNNFHVVLLTKFEITEVKNLSGKEGDPFFETMRALRARLLTPDGQTLNIFIVHLEPFSTKIRLHQLDALMDELELYKGQTTILMGDMNFCVAWPEYTIIEQAGWQHVALATNVDQIWISPDAHWTSNLLPISESSAREVRGLSDHLPVSTELSIYPPRAGAPMSTPYAFVDRYEPESGC
jgi:endonuclease/exonuclease/phosphatase family metal-dependent hydrolase